MDIENLIDTLKQHGVSCVRSYGKYCSICDESATTLSTLQAENEKLRAELNQMKRERDAIDQDFRAFTKQWWEQDSGFPCHWCKFEKSEKCEWKSKHKGQICAGGAFEWRGQKED